MLAAPYDLLVGWYLWVVAIVLVLPLVMFVAILAQRRRRSGGVLSVRLRPKRRPNRPRLPTASGEAEERAASKGFQPIGKLVLSELETVLGKVEDVNFDEGSGALVGFDLGDAGSVAGDRLLGLGSHAVVVQEVPPDEAAPGGP